LLRSEEPANRGGNRAWPAQLREHRVEGIQINTLTERKVDTVLASLIAALVAYGGNAPQESGDAAIRAPQLEDTTETLRLIGRLTPPMEAARGLSAEEAARSIHSCMEQASRGTVRMLLAAMTHYAPQEGEAPQSYLQRLSESLVLEHLNTEFAAGTLAPVSVRSMLNHLADVLVRARTRPSIFLYSRPTGPAMRIASRSLSASGWSFRRVKNPACCAGRKSGACPSPPSARRLATSLKPAPTRRDAKLATFF